MKTIEDKISLFLDNLWSEEYIYMNTTRGHDELVGVIAAVLKPYIRKTPTFDERLSQAHKILDEEAK